MGETWQVYDLVFKELPSLCEKFGVGWSTKGKRRLVNDELKRCPEARLRSSDSIPGVEGDHGEFVKTGKGQGQVWILERYTWPV